MSAPSFRDLPASEARHDLDVTALSTVELAAAIASGELSSEEAVHACLARIDAVNPTLNAVVQLRRERALADARTADQRPRADRGPLHGVPMTIKDSLDTADLITTYGTAGRASTVPRRDATVVARLRAAGAILLGKTNTPELTLSFETDNPVYGRTSNPFDPTRTAGGSSGGAAAIVAARGAPFDIGSDTGGSIRLPAHCCGIAGLRPTAGRVPRTGHAIGFEGASERLTTLGPLARRVDDLTLLFSLIAGPDGVDPHVPPVPVRDPLTVGFRGLRLGTFTALGDLSPTEATVAAVEHAAETLLALGGRRRSVTIEQADLAWPRYTQFLFGDGGAAVHRQLDRYGSGESPLRTRLRSSPATDGREMVAKQEELDAWSSRTLALWGDYDVMICPVYPEPAPLHGSVQRASAAYTQLFSLLGWPVVVVRAGTSPEGLPIGVQLVAPPWREDVALAAGRAVERATVV